MKIDDLPKELQSELQLYASNKDISTDEAAMELLKSTIKTVQKERTKRERLFWTKVEKGPDCWNWAAAKNDSGYGRFWNGHRTVMAHRFSWELHHDQEIPDNKCVLHTCSNKSCVNPAHLKLGTLAKEDTYLTLEEHLKILENLQKRAKRH